jgi:alpha-galactosidase
LEEKIHVAICEKNEWSEKSGPVAVNRWSLIVADMDSDQICEVISLEKVFATVKDA